MRVEQPAHDLVDRIFAEQAHRAPEKASVVVLGDGGEPVKIPLILGNPSGACAMPDGVKPSPVWRLSIGATFGVAEDKGVARPMAEDCVLYPDRATWSRLTARWPALPSSILSLLVEKYGGKMNFVQDPLEQDVLPAELGAATAKNPAAIVRRLTPRGAEFLVVVAPPAAPVWRLFTDGLRQPTSDLWALVRQLVRGQTMAAVRVVGRGEEGEVVAEPVAIDEVITRWPGLAVGLAVEVGNIAGAAMEADLGGW
jgi:hypothetical protein